MWRPYNKVVNGRTGYIKNITLPEPITGGSIVRILSDYNPDRIIISDLPAMMLTYTPIERFTVWCISIKQGEEGRLLWKKTYNIKTDFVEGGQINWGAFSIEDKVFTVWCPQTRQHWGFSLDTGKKIWGSNQIPALMGLYSGNGSRHSLWKTILLWYGRCTPLLQR